MGRGHRKTRSVWTHMKFNEEQKKEYASKTRRQRCLNIDECTDDIKESVMCKLKFKISEQSVSDIQKIVPHLNYNQIGELKVTQFPENKVFNKINQMLNVFDDDIYARSVMCIKAKTNLLTHIDPIRRTSVYIPIYPDGNEYSPLEVYAHNQMYTTSIDKCVVYAWNTKIPHAVFNNRSIKDRYNLQLGSMLSYKEFFKKYNDYFILSRNLESS